MNRIFSLGVVGAGVAGLATTPVLLRLAEKFNSVFTGKKPVLRK
jgi:hypothetical protein